MGRPRSPPGRCTTPSRTGTGCSTPGWRPAQPRPGTAWTSTWRSWRSGLDGHQAREGEIEMVDYRLELILLPVADVDRAKEFYTQRVGFNLDVDTSPREGFRVVQMTPPGSACSVTIGTGFIDTEPGSMRGMHLVVSDIEVAWKELTERRVEVTEIRHMGPNGWEPGPDPDRTDYGSYADFKDPDGNAWVLQ